MKIEDSGVRIRFWRRLRVYWRFGRRNFRRRRRKRSVDTAVLRLRRMSSPVGVLSSLRCFYFIKIPNLIGWRCNAMIVLFV